MIHTWLAKDGAISEVPREGLPAAWAGPRQMLWVDLDAPKNGEDAVLADIFGFHPLAIEDCVSPSHSPKIEEYDGFLYLVCHGIEMSENGRLATKEMDAFIGRDFLVTYHRRHSKSVAALRDRVQRHPEVLSRGPALIFHAILDGMVDNYFPILDALDNRAATLETSVLKGAGHGEIVALNHLRKELGRLRRTTAPQREVAAALARHDYACIPAEARPYFRDVSDHMARLHEQVEALRDLVAMARDTYLSVISNRTNEVMKALTVIATVLLPLNIITGFFGMNLNFAWFPALAHPAVPWVVAGGMAVLSAVLLVLFRRRGWF